MILDHLDNWPSYPFRPAWALAMSFVRSFDQTAPDGEYPIQGRDIYAIVFTRTTTPAQDAIIETHRVYADIQVPLSGPELHARLDPADLSVRIPYDPLRDAQFYHPATLSSTLLVRPGEFAVYLPQDAHACLIQVSGQAESVRKMVVKVKADLL